MKETSVEKPVTFDTGHKGMIHDTQFDFYGRRVATCSSDGCINIFDVPEGDAPILATSIKAHSGPVWQISWAHPRFGNILASCGFDHHVIIWKEVKPNEWEKAKDFNFHMASVNTCSWAPWEYGLVLASGGSDGMICVFTHTTEDNWESVQIAEAHKGGVTSLSWGPSTHPTMVQTGQMPRMRFASGGCDNLVKLWTYNEAAKRYTPEEIGAHEDWVRDVAFANNIGLPYETIATCSEDQTVAILRWSEGGWKSTKLPKFHFPVWRVSWSLAGNMLAVAAADNIVIIFEEQPNGSWVRANEINPNAAEKE